jgi:apurinic endonuclease APN1
MLLGSQTKIENTPRSFLRELQRILKDGNVLNFCRVPAGLLRIQWAYKMLDEDMILADKMGCKGVIIHMCSRRAVNEKWKEILLTKEETINRTIEHINYFLKTYKPKVRLLLENSATDGYKIAGSLIDLGKIFKPLYKKHKDKVGICLDTCHAFSSGYALNTIEGVENFFKDYKKYVGEYSTIKLIHLNDSYYPIGSKKDRHEVIGKGYIFKNSTSLCYLVHFCKEQKIPLCLETKGSFLRQLKYIKSSCFEVDKKEVSKILREFYKIHKSLGNTFQANQYLEAYYSGKFGAGISSKIEEYARTGKIALLEEFRNNPIIQAHLELTSVYGIGPQKASELISQGIFTIKDLHKAKLTKAQKIGLQYHQDLSQKISRKEAEKIRDQIDKKLTGKDKYVELAGSYRLGKKKLGDIDIIISVKKNDLDFKEFIEKLNLEILSQSNSNVIALTDTKPVRHIDIHYVRWEDIPYHLLYFSSGEYFSRKIRKMAKDKGYKLNDKGLYYKNKKIKVTSEKDIFKKLGIPWVPPEKRYKDYQDI